MDRREFVRLLSLVGVSVGIRPSALFAKPYNDTTSWDPFVDTITDVDTYLRRKFRQDVTDKATGMDVAGLKRLLDEIVVAGKASGESWRITKAKCFASQAMKMAIDVSPYDWFPAISVWNRWNRPITGIYWRRAGEVNQRVLPPEVLCEWDEGNRNGDWSIWQDFDHSVPDWRVILKLGFPGMEARLLRIAQERKVEKVGGGGQWSYDDPFYEGLRISIEAVLGCIDRFIAQAEKNLSVHSTTHCHPIGRCF